MKNYVKRTMGADEALELVKNGKAVLYKGRPFELANSGSNYWLEWERYYEDYHTTCVWTPEDGDLEVEVEAD